MKLTSSFCAILLSTAIQSIAQIGTLEFFETTVDGFDREYYLFVPPSYDGSSAVPLVLNLHGSGSSAPEQVAYSKMNLVADTAGFLVAIPEAVDSFWSSGFSFVPPTAPDDVNFLLTMIDEISANYAVDADRVYSTGMSNGGFMSYRLACEATDRFAAIASVTGSMADNTFSSCAPSMVMPVLEIHGTNDLTVPYEGSATSTAISDVLGFWVNHNGGCPSEPVVTDIEDIQAEGCTVKKYQWNPCKDWSEVLHFEVLNGGHSWPGSFPIPGLGCTNQDIKAHVEIWNFFKRHRRSDMATGLNNVSAPEEAIFPNPAQNGWLFAEAANSLVQIYNSTGILIQEIRTDDHGWIDASALENGIYQLVSEQGVLQSGVLMR